MRTYLADCLRSPRGRHRLAPLGLYPPGDRTDREDPGISPALGYEPVGSTRRILDEGPPRVRPAGPAAGHGLDGRTAPRDDRVHRPDGPGPGTSAPRPASQATRGGGRGSRLRRRLDPAMVPGPRHRVGHSSATTDRAGSSPDLRRAEVRAPQAPPERLVGRLKERRRLDGDGSTRERPQSEWPPSGRFATASCTGDSRRNEAGPAA